MLQILTEPVFMMVFGKIDIFAFLCVLSVSAVRLVF